MKDIERISEKVEKRKLQLQALFTKDKENYDLWAGKEQIFDTHPMSVNITGTEMTALSRRTQASITRSRLDIHVWTPKPLENPDAVDAANQEERMWHHGFRMADERLVMIGEAPLLPATSWQAINLGRPAVRVLVYKDKDTGEIIWDYLPLNVSFLPFVFDSKGLAWTCYETFRSPDSIKAEYRKDVTEDAQGKGVSVSDYWDRKDNVTYLTKEKEILKTRKNKAGEVPVILQPVAGAPKVIDVEGIQVTAWGQSIFDHIKTSFRSLNKMRSIAATHAHLLANRPTEEIYEDGTDPNIEEAHVPYHPGALIKHPKTIELKPMDVADIPASLMAMMGDLSRGLERASYAALNPDKPAHSGTALRILGQDKLDFEAPSVATMNTLYTRICRMAKKQIIAEDLSIPVKTVVNGEYQVYEMTPDLLDNDFYIEAEFISQDVYDEVEALSRAQMFLQNRLMSREDVMERILNEQDVPAQISKMDLEDVEAAIPEMKLLRLVKDLQEREMGEEAKMVEEQLALLILQKQQALQGGIPGAEGTPSPSPPSPTGGMPERPGVVPGVPR